jgi:hypothetical protein
MFGPAAGNWLKLPGRNGGRNVFATLLLALTPGQYVDSKEFPREKQEAALAATAGIVHVATNGEGTAVVVKHDKQKGVVYLLTAAHVVPPGEQGNWVKLDFYSSKPFAKLGSTVDGVVMARMPNEDIAVVQAVVKNAPAPGVLRICPLDKQPKGEQQNVTILTVGCDGPNRAPQLLTDVILGRAFPAKPSGAKVLCWETKRPPVQGRSGGPLIDQRGYLTGICSGTEKKRGYYTHILDIRKALDGAGLGWLGDDELKVPAKQEVGIRKNPEKN